MIIGIDPGKSGAIAVLPPIVRDGESVQTIRLDRGTPQDIAEWLRERTDREFRPAAYIERVHASPQMGVVSAFSFGRSFGWLLGLLDCLRIPYEFVTPRTWQSRLGCLTGGDKNVSKAAAQRLWPNVKITHGIADALLIAEYGRRYGQIQNRGQQK